MKQLRKYEKNYKHEGYVAIITVLLISVVTLSIALSTTFLGIDQGQTSLAVKKGDETRLIAESCIENAIKDIKTNPGYTGETFPIFGGSCTTTASSVGSTWTVDATGVKDEYTKRVQAVFSLTNGTVGIIHWREIQ